MDEPYNESFNIWTFWCIGRLGKWISLRLGKWISLRLGKWISLRLDKWIVEGYWNISNRLNLSSMLKKNLGFVYVSWIPDKITNKKNEENTFIYDSKVFVQRYRMSNISFIFHYFRIKTIGNSISNGKICTYGNNMISTLPGKGKSFLLQFVQYLL